LTELFPPAIGGSAVLFDEIYSRLRDRADITVLTDSVASPRSATIADRVPVVRRPIATRRWGLASVHALAHHLRVVRYLRALSTARAGLIHCGRALPEGVAAYLNRALGGPRYVCWCHGEDVGCARLSRELTIVMTRVYRAAAMVFANSENTRRMLVDLGVPVDRIEVVYPGVDAARFHPAVDGHAIRERHGLQDHTVALSVGRLQRRKGHDRAIEAIGRLRTIRPALRYLIVGEGEERSRLEQLARECGVADRVIFAGAVAAEDLPAYYAACDIFLLPNRIDGEDIEGFGIVFLEAAASGKPTIGGTTGGVPEAVEDGVTGVLVSGTDVAELAATLDGLATTPDLRREMGDAGRMRVMAKFTWDRAAEMVAAAQVRAASDGGRR
jgi:phosphatidylinositol alpha-1,6-mannosyltransferase